MPIGISALAYALRVGSGALPKPFSHGHAQQLIAAAMGHKSLASYQTSKEELPDLSGTRHVVVDTDLLHERLLELGYAYDNETIFALLTTSLQKALPGVRTYRTKDAFDDALRDFIDETVSNNGNVINQVTMSNGSPGEVYLPFETSLDDIPLGDSKEFQIRGHVSLEQDLERPYNGHKVRVEVSLYLTRTGRVCVGQPEVTVTHAELLYYEDEDHDEEGPKVSLAQALSDQLGITLAEAQMLEDADLQANESNDGGLVYSHILDAASVNLPPELQAKLLEKFGSLSIELPAFFYDNVHWSPYD
ncbi:peptide ABC transporter permease [Burkholderia ubonensis]|uniref:Peptide ABC transporter permease n=1 Tax=Burkholderia ubonensis TaxID=101571 RepID=A0AAW3MYN0_9BURK|nr:hypothetical protein [Burkholderia ubonensis]KVP65643.1 peptide ABC transporter permease [Burkholderia ubonensis]KVP98408.1 peptide ABC transporter permease [Burkholderia ubonensis]KVZ93107.1 peptide ABC transporter permease [Burkholderia ubonensis]